MKTKLFLICIFMLLCNLTFLSAQTTKTNSYQIVFKVIPPSGSGPEKTSIISGKVTGPDASSLKIILYAKGGEKWWVQPTTDSPFTRISNDGTWQNETHLGSQYAALLVKKSYIPANTLNTLPQPDDLVLLINVADAKN